MVIGLPSGAKAEELDHEEIHEKFVKQLAQVTKFDFDALIYFNYILPMKGLFAKLKGGPKAAP